MFGVNLTSKDIPPRPVTFSSVGSILLIFNTVFVFLLILFSFHLMGEEVISIYFGGGIK